MRKSLTILVLLLASGFAMGQTTAVTATVVDSDSTVWANGTWTLAFKVGPSQHNPAAYTIGGVALDKTVAYQTGTADGSGVITFTTYRSSSISPIGSSWNLTVCPNSSSKCSTINFTTSGSSQDISTQVNAAILAPRFQAVSGNYGYADIEAVLQLRPGSTYYNVTSGLRCYNGSSWTPCGGGGAVSPGGVNTNVQYNNTGSFGGATHFLTDGSHQAMGAASAIDTGQWNAGFGMSGPTDNILNLQEINTSPLGENGSLSIVNWNPVGDPTAFDSGSSGGVSQLNLDIDSTTGATFFTSYGQVGSVTSLGNTIGGFNGIVGTAGYASIEGNAAPKYAYGGADFVYVENPNINNTNGAATGVEGYVEVDAGHFDQVYGVWASYYVDPSASVRRAINLYLQNPGLQSNVTTAYAIFGEDQNLYYFHGPIQADALTGHGTAGIVQADGSGNLSQSPALANGSTATTQTVHDNTTRIATTAYVDNATKSATAGGAVASATSITPTGQIFHITGTTAVATIIAPAECTSANSGCQITLIPDAVFTTTIADNIALASTAVLNKALIMTYDSGTSKWYPSY